MSYYAERARRDPAGREAQVAAAVERERRRRERDPEAFRAARREAMRRYRAKLREHGLTFKETRALNAAFVAVANRR